MRPTSFTSFCFSRFAGASFSLLLTCALLAGCGKDDPVKSAEARPRTRFYAYGLKIFFGAGGDSERFRLMGWSTTEGGFTWTDGIAASLNLRVPPSKDAVTLKVHTMGMNHRPMLMFQPVDVFVNRTKIAHWEVAEDKVYSATIPKEFVVTETNLIIDFYIPEARSPAELGLGGDFRRLGLRCAELEIIEQGTVGTP